MKLFLINENKIVPENIIYISFEDKSKLTNFTRNPAAYIESFLKRDNKAINNGGAVSHGAPVPNG